MARVQKTPLAEADLTDIWLSKANRAEGSAYATRFLLELDTYLQKRARFPKGIQPCSEPFSDLRVISFQRLNVYCRSRPDGIDIIRVLWNSEEPNAQDFSETG